MANATRTLKIVVDHKQALAALKSIKDSSQQTAKATDKTALGITNINNQIGKLGASFNRIGDLAKKLALLGGIKLGVDGLLDLVKATSELEKLDNVLRGAVGPERFANSMDYLREAANKFGLDMKSVQTGFSGFAAAALGAGLSLEQAQAAFDGVLVSAAKFQLSNEDVKGALLGLQQLIGSTNVNLEDLRQVLDRIPGGMAAATAAASELTGKTSLTTGEFKKLVSDGLLPASTYVPLLSKHLSDMNMEGAAQNANSLTAEMNRFNNAVNELIRALGESGLLSVLSSMMSYFTEFLGFLRAAREGIWELTRAVQSSKGVLNEAADAQLADISAQIAQQKALIESLKNPLGPVSDPMALFLQQEEAEKRLLELEAQREARINAIAEGQKQVTTAIAGQADVAEKLAQKLDKVNPELATNVTAMIADAASQGLKIGISDGFRTTEKQAQLWMKALAKYGSAEIARKFVAPPGRSAHEKGLAIDLDLSKLERSNENVAKLNALLDKYNLKAPVATETTEKWAAGFSHVHITLDKTTKSLTKTRKEQDVSTRSQEAATRETERLRNGYQDLVFSGLDPMAQAAARGAKEVEQLKAALAAGAITNEEYATGLDIVARKTTANIDALAKKTEEATDATDAFGNKIQTMGELMLEAGKTTVSSFQSMLSDGIYAMFDGSLNSVKDYLKRFKEIVLKTIADLIAQVAAQKIVVPIIASVLGVEGAAASGASGAVGDLLGGATGEATGGLLDLAGAAKSLYGVWQSTGAIFANAATTIGSALGLSAGTTTALAGAASTAGPWAIAAFALSSLFTDDFNTKVGSSIGAAAGSVIGTAIAGPLGSVVGGLLGGVAGGFLGSLTGSSPDNRVGANITYEQGRFRVGGTQHMSAAADAELRKGLEELNTSLQQLADFLGPAAQQALSQFTFQGNGQDLTADQIESWVKNESGRAIEFMVNAAIEGMEGAGAVFKRYLYEAKNAGGVEEMTALLAVAGAFQGVVNTLAGQEVLSNLE
jgi:tape measure domain-containing protein